MDESQRLRIAMVGTRGVPARYGGFETAVEEVGARLADAGHEVTVYCRTVDGDPPSRSSERYRGMRRVVLPSLRHKALGTLSHTFLSGLDALVRRRFDAVFLFNAANAPMTPLLRRRGARVAIHVDGLESRRGKWGKIGRRYYRFAESLSVRWADALIADARAIGDYYQHQFDAQSAFIAYGAPVLDGLADDALESFGVEAGRFHLVVARFEPENHVDLIVDGYRRSAAQWPCVVVGGAPFADEYVARIESLADGDPRIRLTGPVWDQDALDQLYYHAGSYLHGHSVGGTNPSLLRAMGAGAAVVAFDGPFSREVLADTGYFFSDANDLADRVVEIESDIDTSDGRGAAARAHAAATYSWDDVAADYEGLARSMVAGVSRRGERSGRRVTDVEWNSPSLRGMPSADRGDAQPTTPTTGR